MLISEQGEVKLTDFGIAKALGRRERTGAGIIKGKLAFMSPERASGGSLDARSDLFSVGTMLYLMATGKRPFERPPISRPSCACASATSAARGGQAESACR